jgi:hypothetical protein
MSSATLMFARPMSEAVHPTQSSRSAVVGVPVAVEPPMRIAFLGPRATTIWKAFGLGIVIRARDCPVTHRSSAPGLVRRRRMAAVPEVIDLALAVREELAHRRDGPVGAEVFE